MYLFQSPEIPRQNPAAYLKVKVDCKNPLINRQTQNTFTFSSVFYFPVLACSSCRALATLGIGSSLPFCTEKRSALLRKSEVPLLLCPESSHSSLRKYVRGSISRANRIGPTTPLPSTLYHGSH